VGRRNAAATVVAEHLGASGSSQLVLVNVASTMVPDRLTSSSPFLNDPSVTF
jgi:hypothetical protein